MSSSGSSSSQQEQLDPTSEGPKKKKFGATKARPTPQQKRTEFRRQAARRAAEFKDVSSRAVGRVLAFGGGVQSTACLLMFADEYTHVVFADPGAEKPETIEHINRNIKPFCRDRNIEFVRVAKHQSLEDYCREKRRVPLRTMRWCTTDFKVGPMLRFYKEVLHATAEHPVIVDLGISRDEAWRASSPDRTAYEWRNYPLVDKHITREQCAQAIAAYGWPLPVKSSCDFCPFAGRKHWLRLRGERPDRFAAIVDLEEQGADYPHTTLTKFPLRVLLENTQLTDHGFDDELDQGHECKSGFCFT